MCSVSWETLILLFFPSERWSANGSGRSDDVAACVEFSNFIDEMELLDISLLGKSFS